ncbi:hypothetical protein [Xanthomonas graminis]|uniref:Uncharacterized protein n=2 Tax=Xanthomonas translucens group TaxID=3390202 RepID=A0A1M4JKC8_9XANT|nr:hypothetical protein XTG29_03163 [Xanthomonas translucens pv. graminis ART-Xtg29]UKE55217.1 hypothetical protein KFS84_05180 [Xanthomonas translucens pv. graminis]WIH09574.1 hypothetical protein KM579_05665 [Xanthomonas translucens pv. graminis]WIH12901.1 hypothetical protein KM563_03650 [Xanthomonas translucens pv. graminis]WIH15308.1 hypothetical protein KM433_15855 [Xanthomonas translucens pv. graminis]
MRPVHRPRPRHLLVLLFVAGMSWLLLQRAATAEGARAATAPAAAPASRQRAVSAADMSSASPSSSASVPGPSAREVIAAAQALPADFQADALLRIADANDLPLTAGGDRRDAALRLAQQASVLAERAMRRMPGLASAGYASEEHGDELRDTRTAGLDRLSLQTRAARSIATSPAQAAALFAALPTPQAAGCETELIDDPSPTYALATALQPAQAAPQAAALAERVDQAQQETDVAPALKMVLASTTLQRNGQTQVADSLLRMFARIRGNDPGFTATELSVAADMPLLLQWLQDAALRERLHAAYRTYVAAHLAQARCPASLRGNHWLLEQRFVAELPNERIPPAPPVVQESIDDEAISLIREAGYNVRTQLLLPDASATDPALEKASTEFLDQLDHGVLQQTAAGDGSGRVQRARLRELLRYLEYAPSGAARDRGVALMAALLSGPYYAQDHDTWFGDLHVVAAQMQRWPDRAQRLAQLAEHRDPVVKVYAMLMQRGQFP